MRTAHYLLLLGLACTSIAACAAGSGDATQSTGSAGPEPAAGNGGPTTCTETDDGVGCCDPGGTILYYCTKEGVMMTKTCASGQTCGWDSANVWYDCGASPGGPEPTHTYPMACGGNGTTIGSSSGGTSSSSTSGGSTSGSSTSSSSSSSASSSGTSAVTWTELYNGVFGTSGTSNCALSSACHLHTQSGFQCGTTKTTCYDGLVSAGLVMPGAGASSSVLVTSGQSPLCGSLGGNMPRQGACVTSAQLAQIQAWLGSGAPDN
jgi:hypothetical protein